MRAASERLSPAARRQALVALAFVDDARAAQAMADLTRSQLRDVASQAAWWIAYRKTNDWRAYPVDGWTIDAPEPGLSSLDEVVAGRTLVLDAAAPIDRRIEAALALARSGVGAPLLLQLAAENRIAYQLREAIGSVIFTNPDRAVRAVAAGYFQPPGGGRGMTVEDVTKRAGSAVRGEARFVANCSTCHRVGGGGAEVGPDLTAIANKFDLAGLVDAIANPGGAISLGFTPELLITTRNESYIGFVQGDGAVVTLRDGYGRPIALDRGRIAARVPLKGTLMPDPLALGLTEQDIADIAAFLMTERK
jgi:putative heme-binding domain-containing protein